MTIKTVNDVLKLGFCIGCGACAYKKETKISMAWNDIGMYQPVLKKSISKNIDHDVCPFTDGENESDISNILFDGSQFDETIGFYEDLHIGSVADKTIRLNASSGGLDL